MTTPHPHAEILRAIADGKTVQIRSIAVRKDGDDRWWELMQLNYLDNSDYEFRIKPETININGHEVPGPLRVAPPNGTEYWCAATGAVYPVIKHAWNNDGYDLHMLKRGTAHLTEEAALAHAKALLSFTGVKGD